MDGRERSERVVQKSSFAAGDERWKGAVEVVRRTVNRDGREVIYSDLRIRIGNRFLSLPRDSDKMEEIIAAYRNAQSSALADHASLLQEIRARGRPQPYQPPGGVTFDNRRDGLSRGSDRGRKNRNGNEL